VPAAALPSTDQLKGTPPIVFIPLLGDDPRVHRGTLARIHLRSHAYVQICAVEASIRIRV